MATIDKLNTFYNAVATAFPSIQVKKGFAILDISEAFNSNILDKNQILISYDNPEISTTEQNFFVRNQTCKVFIMEKYLDRNYFGDVLLANIDTFTTNSGIKKLCSMSTPIIGRYSGEIYYCEINCTLR